MTIVAKDVRRLRGLVGLLVALTVVKFGLGWWLALGEAQGFATWTTIGDVVKWLILAEVVLTWFLTGSLVMADPLVGPKATWRTRPISAARLMTAKVVGALLITCGPTLVLGLPWWWASGLGFEDALRVAVLGLMGAVAVIVPSMFIAVLVDSMGRYVLWSIAGFSGVMMMPLAANTIAELFSDGGGWSGIGAVAVGVAVLGWVVRFNDELQRRVFRGVACGTAGVVVVGWWWLVANGGLTKQSAWTQSNVEQGRDVKLTWRETTVTDVAWKRQGWPVNSWLAVEGVPAGLAIDVNTTQHVWTWADGGSVEKIGGGYPTGARWVREAFKLPPEKADAETATWEAARRKQDEAKKKSAGQLGRQSWGDAATLLASATISPALGEKLRGTTPSLTVKAQVRVVRPAEWLDVPLVAGARAAGDGRGVRVIDVAERGGRGVDVQIVDTRALPWNFLSEYNSGRWRQPKYYGVDRDAGRLASFNSDTSPSVWIGGVELQAQTFTVVGPRVIRDGKWTVVDAQWRQRMRLVLLRWDEVARVTREAKTEKFAVSP